MEEKTRKNDEKGLLPESADFEELELSGGHESQEVSGGFLPGIHRFPKDDPPPQNKTVSH